MKKIIFFALALCASITASAQENSSKQMYIHMKSGEVMKIACDDIDSLTFNDSEKPQELGFNIEVTDVKGTSIAYTITPTDEEANYFFDMLYRDKYETEKANYGGSIFGFDKAYYEWIASMYGETWYDFMLKFMSQGTQNIKIDPYDNTLRWNREYVIYCYGINEDGTQSTPTTEKVVKTAEPIPSDNVITVEISDITSTGININTKTTNDDQYFMTAQEKSKVDLFEDDDELAYSLLTQLMYSTFVFKNGDFSGSDGYNNLKADTDYVLVVFGYDDDYGPSTAYQKIEFHTLPNE